MNPHDDHAKPGTGLWVLAAVVVSIALALGALLGYVVPSAPYALDGGDRCAAAADGNSKSTGWSLGAKCIATAGGAKRDFIAGPRQQLAGLPSPSL